MMNEALDNIEKNLEAEESSSSSETDYEPENADHGRGKRKKVPSKRLASSPQVCGPFIYLV